MAEVSTCMESYRNRTGTLNALKTCCNEHPTTDNGSLYSGKTPKVYGLVGVVLHAGSFPTFPSLWIITFHSFVCSAGQVCLL